MARRRQALSTAARLAVFYLRDREWRKLVSRHSHLHQGPSAKAKQGLQNQLEKAARAYGHPLYFAGADRAGC